MLLNDFSQTVRERILAASESLGEIKQVLDRDEDPDIIADNAILLPTCCVIPVGGGKLTAKFQMNSSDMIEDFQQNIVIYYQQSKDNKLPYSDIEVLRGYAKVLINLFSSNDRTSPYYRCFNSCVVTQAVAEFHPYQARDVMLDRILCTLSCKCVEI